MRPRIAAAMGLACLVGAVSGCAGSSSESRARGTGDTEACGSGPLPVDTTSGPQFLAPMGRLAGLTRQNIPVPAVDVDDARPRVMEDADPKLVPRLDASPYLSLGQAWFDRDNDGDLDVYFSGQTRGGPFTTTKATERFVRSPLARQRWPTRLAVGWRRPILIMTGMSTYS